MSFVSSLAAPAVSAEPKPWVICLCADWCGLCRDYLTVLAELAARHPHHRFVWLDIEDHADLTGDFEVETFPTLLLADAGGTRFLGPLTPQPETLARLLHSWAGDSLASRPHDGPTQRLLDALPDLPELWVSARTGR